MAASETGGLSSILRSLTKKDKKVFDKSGKMTQSSLRDAFEILAEYARKLENKRTYIICG